MRALLPPRLNATMHWIRDSIAHPPRRGVFPIVMGLLLCLGALESTARDAALEKQLTAPRPIAAGASPWLEELTWMEIRDLIAAGTTTAIIPTGGVEQNGPFLSTGKHNLIVEGVCAALAQELGNALCAPIVKFVPEGDIDPPSGMMRFPGSISVSNRTYEALLTDIAASLRQAGFTDIVLLGDSGSYRGSETHGGNQSGMGNVATALNTAWRDDKARMHFIGEYYDPGWEATEEYTRRELGIDETRKDGYHDDIWVTAMMAVADPEQIRYRQRLEAGLDSINGVELTPLARTVELGQAMIDFRARYTAALIRESISQR